MEQEKGKVIEVINTDQENIPLEDITNKGQEKRRTTKAKRALQVRTMHPRTEKKG